MNKRLEEYAKSKGLVTVKESGLVYGKIREMFVVIQEAVLSDVSHTIQMGIKKGEKEPQESIEEFLAVCQERHSYLKGTQYENKKLMIQFQASLKQSKRNYVLDMEKFLEELAEYCEENGMLMCCEECAREGMDLYEIDGIPHILCSNCFKKQEENSILSEGTKEKQQKTKMISGCLGAIIGVAVTGPIWFGTIVNHNRWMTLGTCLIVLVASMAGFQIFGKRLNVAGVICSYVIASVVYICAVLFNTVRILIDNDYYGYYLHHYYYPDDIGEYIPLIQELLTIDRMPLAILGMSAGGIIFMGIWAFGFGKKANRENSRKMQTRKLASVEQQKQGV